MKPISFVALFLFVSLSACKKDKIDSAISLHRKWQPFSLRILKMDDSFNQGACNYQTKISDMYGPSDLIICRKDDVYDFTAPQTLTVNSGTKCSPNELSVSVKPYERRGDSLFIEGYPYYIVSLSRDTMILDYCSDVNTSPPGTVIINRTKLGIKFVALK